MFFLFFKGEIETASWLVQGCGEKVNGSVGGPVYWGFVGGGEERVQESEGGVMDRAVNSCVSRPFVRVFVLCLGFEVVAQGVF